MEREAGSRWLLKIIMFRWVLPFSIVLLDCLAFAVLFHSDVLDG